MRIYGGDISGSLTITGSLIVSGSISGGTYSGQAVTALTASSADNFIVRNNLTGSNVLLTGNLTAETLTVQQITSSIIYSSGSNIFGNKVTDIQQLTGSVSITGSFNTSNDARINGFTFGKGNGNITTNTTIGFESLKINTIGCKNTALGYRALANNTDGHYNTAIGYNALKFNTYGGTNVALGTYALEKNISGNNNVAVGFATLYKNTSGVHNIGIGRTATCYTTSGSRNIGIGGFALNNVRNGNDNTNIGYKSGFLTSCSCSNTAIGAYTMIVSGVGGRNTAVGAESLRLNKSSGSVAIGFSALCSNSTGQSNTAIGYEALKLSTVGSKNTAVGFKALKNSTATGFNTALGYIALTSNTTAVNNTAVGTYALTNTTSGRDNTAIGNSTLRFNTIGTRNTALGNGALSNNTTGNDNLSLGYLSMYCNRTGAVNIAVGHSALRQNFSGNRNIGVGFEALRYNTGGSGNIALGDRAMKCNTTGTKNTAIGYFSLFNNLTNSNNVAVGYKAACLLNGANNVVIGGYTGSLSKITENNNIFLSDGVGNLRIFSTGSNGAVGIGTSSPNPSAMLHVESNTTTFPNGVRILLQNSTDGQQWHLINGGEPTGLGNFAIRDGSVGENRMTILSGSGNVGIGISSPTYKFSVLGTNNSGLWLKQGNQIQDSPSATDFYGGLTFENQSTTNAWSIGYSQGADFSINYYDGASTYTRVMTVDNLLRVGIGVATPASKLHISGSTSAESLLRIQNNTGTEVMFVSSSGNVGIGTTSPSATLNVFGSDNILILTSSNDNQSFEITFNSNANSFFEAFNEQGETAWYNYTYSGSYRYDFIGYDGMFFRYGHPYGQSNIMETFATRSSPFLFSYYPGGSNEANATLDMEIRDHRWVGVNGNSFAKFASSGSFAISDSGTYYEMQSKVANSPIIRLRHSGTTQPIGMWVEFSAASPDNNTEYFFRGSDSTTDRIYIYSDGDLANHDGVYGSISDIKLKQDIVDATAQWDDIKNIRFRKYRLKKDVEINPNAPYLLGVVAQELELTSPGLVESHPDFEQVEVPALSENGEQLKDREGNLLTKLIDEPTGTYTKTVKSSILLMKSAKALQEALLKIEELEERIKQLESKVI